MALTLSGMAWICSPVRRVGELAAVVCFLVRGEFGVGWGWLSAAIWLISLR
jgi:hypothetical protein